MKLSDPKLPILPSDSSIHHWMAQWYMTEVYPSWQIATALAVYGAVLRRNVCFGLGRIGQIWPNTSVLLVGPSGDGKDTIIKPATELTRECGIKTISGRTIEMIKESIFNLAPVPGEAAAGVIEAAELSALLGQKDYQQGIVTDLTDILSSGKSVDISLKSSGERALEQPTITMFAGSTKDWLLTMLPEGSLEGGFLPRFVIVPERSKRDAGVRTNPHPGRLSKSEHDAITTAEKAFRNHVRHTAIDYTHRRDYNQNRKPIEILEVDGAAAWFENWYEHRHEMFPGFLAAFATRSAILVRKLAMLMAITRGHNWIEEDDYEFAGGFVRYTGSRLEGTVVPMSREVVASYSVMDMLPARESELLLALSGKYGTRSVKDGIRHLVESGQVRMEDGRFVKIKKEGHESPST